MQLYTTNCLNCPYIAELVVTKLNDMNDITLFKNLSM